VTLPTRGRPREALRQELASLRAGDVAWQEGKAFSLVYFAGEEVLDVIRDAYATFVMSNGLGPAHFPSLKKLESQILGATAELLHAPESAGNVTSGGTESILMAVKTARDRARSERPDIAAPEMIVPVSVHPAFEKAAHYLGVQPVRIPVRADLRADVDAARAAIGPSTILIVGSAPSYPHGVIDPIHELAALAAEHGVLCHVDACVGGFFLPFAEKLGHPVPPWDFRVPGVTSISADLHKYGYAPRGTSTVMYRTRALRRHQFFAYPDWSGGLYGTPTMAGSRPGALVAGAWAVMQHLGEEGYLRLTRTVLDTSRRFLDGIRETPGLEVMGAPDMSVLAFRSDTLDVYALADAMDERGWRLERQQRPPSLHLVITPAHAGAAPAFLADLREAAAALEGSGPAIGGAAMYGLLGSVPDRALARGFILDFLDGMNDE
jgi:sphinganine-1-phosphate aldolase